MAIMCQGEGSVEAGRNDTEAAPESLHPDLQTRGREMGKRGKERVVCCGV